MKLNEKEGVGVLFLCTKKECLAAGYSNFPRTAPTTQLVSVAASSSKSSSSKQSSFLADESDHRSGKNDEGVHGFMKKGTDTKWYLQTARGKTSEVWSCFKVYDVRKHQDKKNFARCIRCGQDIYVKNGTAGLTTHMQFIHPDVIYRKNSKSNDSSVSAKRRIAGGEGIHKSRTTIGINERYNWKVKPKPTTCVEKKEVFLKAVTAWVIDQNMPFDSVEKPSFRRMFSSIVDDKYADLFKTTAKTIRSRILHLGHLSKQATKKEMIDHEFSLTTDHWTGPDDETYTTLTAHYIEDKWMIKSCVLDFKVFHGSTSGNNCAEDLFKIFDEYGFKDENVTIVVTDTTGSMNTFGQKLRDDRKYQHKYCFDHNIHRNCILAYDGMYLCFGFPIHCFNHI